MKQNLINKKECLKGIGTILLYLLLPSFISIPFLFFIKKKSILYFLVYLICTIIFLLFYQKELKEEWSSFKKSLINYMKSALFYWFIGIIIMIITSHLLSSAHIFLINQEENIKIIKEMPFTQTIILSIFTPIMEELAFRKSFNKAFSSNGLYLIITSILFAFLHIISSLNNPFALLYLIPFTSLGLTFGFTYKKTNNIFPSILIHAIHNIITLIDIVILGGLL